MPTATLETDLTNGLDCLAFSRYVSGFARLDPWQEDVLLSNSKRIILNNARQVGKSVTASLLALHLAVYEPDSLALLLSPSLRQSSEVFQCVHGFYRTIAEDVPARMESALRLTLRNGSRIISLPGQESTIRGYSGVDLLIVDEASRVPDDLFHAISPMLAVSDGRLILLSTPYGKRGFFYDTWEHGKEWKKTRITAAECPRISPEFLKQERASMPKWFWSQEYNCSFEANEASIFDYEAIEAMAREGIATWDIP